MTPKYILCIDDDPNVLRALQRLFRDEEIGLLAATCAEHFENCLRMFPVSLVITDIRMPETPGWEILASVREQHPNIPRLVLTAYTDTSILNATSLYGQPDAIMTKPWDNQELKRTVSQLIGENAPADVEADNNLQQQSLSR